MCAREERGTLIAAVCNIIRKGAVWLVPSQSGEGKYTVSPDEQSPYCSCPDHETRGVTCKHIFAVRMVIEREHNSDGSETVTQTTMITATTKRKTYPQQWPEYNKAQVNEKRHFQELLHDLCEGIAEPTQVGKGNRLLPRRDAVFAAVYKIYSTVSARRFMTDLNESHSNGFIDKCPCYNSIFKCLENPEITQVLTDLIIKASLPLGAIETDFAVDSSGFSASKFVRWFDHKYGKIREEHDWVKAQGQRTLSRFAEENFEEEVVVPSAASSLHSDALLAGVLLEQ
jgi:hypothetical protein